MKTFKLIMNNSKITINHPILIIFMKNFKQNHQNIKIVINQQSLNVNDNHKKIQKKTTKISKITNS